MARKFEESEGFMCSKIVVTGRLFESKISGSRGKVFFRFK
jgi:hypothetical protein